MCVCVCVEIGLVAIKVEELKVSSATGAVAIPGFGADAVYDSCTATCTRTTPTEIYNLRNISSSIVNTSMNACACAAAGLNTSCIAGVDTCTYKCVEARSDANGTVWNV